MKVVSWTRRLSFSQSTIKSTSQSSSKSSSPTRTRLKKSVSSLSRLLSPSLRRQRRRESKVLLPLRIKLDIPCEFVVRSPPTARDRSQIRLLLQQRVSQRIRDRSRAAVIREARTQLARSENVQEDVYVPFDFARERKLGCRHNHNHPHQGEELYMAMS